MDLTTEYPDLFFRKNFAKINGGKSCLKWQGTIFCNYYCTKKIIQLLVEYIV